MREMHPLPSLQPSPASPTRPFRTVHRLIVIQASANPNNPIPLIQDMFNFIYARASRFTIIRDNSPSVDFDSMHHPAQHLEPPPAHCMARIPVDLYRTILEHFASDQATSRADLFALLTVSKALSFEVKRLLYNSLTLTADKPKPTFTDATYLLVRNLKMVFGNRSREAEHIRRCEAILPRLVRLVSLEIRGRAWNMDALERCLPLPGGGCGMVSLRSLALDASLTPQVARFIAAQPELQELDLVGGMVTTVTPEALAALPPALPALTKLNTSNTICNHLLPLAPQLKHVKLAFDLSETLPDVLSTISSLPPSTVSVFFNTTRKDLTPALAALPRTLKNLSTVLVLDQQEALLEHLSTVSSLEQLVLNVHQSPPSLINPWSSPNTSPSGSNPPSNSPSPSLSSMVLPVFPSSPKSSPRRLAVSLGVDSPPVLPEQSSPERNHVQVGGDQGQEVEPLVIALKSCLPSLTAIHLDERTYSQRRRSWVSTSTSESTSSCNSNEWKCVQNINTAEFKTSSRANELELWESLH